MVTLSDAQYNQLLAKLSVRLLSSSSSPSTREASSGAVSVRMCDDHGMTLVNPLTPIWLIDSGASRHICANRSLFTTLKPLHNSMVTLPNHTSLPVSFSGEVIMNDCLILRDVLYVPSFKFNIISVSALTLNSTLVVLFSDDGFLIQDINNKKMIGKVGDGMTCTYTKLMHLLSTL